MMGNARHISLKRKENSEVLKETLTHNCLFTFLNLKESMAHHFLQVYFVRSYVSFKACFDLIYVVHGDGGKGKWRGRKN